MSVGCRSRAALAVALVMQLSACGVAGRAIERNLSPRGGDDLAGGRRATERAAANCGGIRVEDVLGCEERLWAESAWKYVVNNTHPKTGLVNRTQDRPVASVYDIADAIAATYAARELGLIDTCTFDARFGNIVGFLNSMPIVDNIAPNRWYDIANSTMVNAENKPAVVGWSAIEIGRLLTWLKIVEARHPYWSEYIGRAVARWNFCAIVEPCGALNRGIHTGPDTNRLEQEGRLGYEEYAAAGFTVWGFGVSSAAAIEPSVEVTVGGVPMLHDARARAATGVSAPLTTSPFAQYEMEFGSAAADANATRYRELGRSVARAQYERFRRTRSMTAKTDRPLASPPWHVYDSVWSDGYEWNAVDANGRSAPYFSTVSTAAVFELWAAYPDEVADRMLDFACSLRDPERGWFAGRSERTGDADDTLALRTNAAVLEALLFKARGVIYRPSNEPSWLAVNTRDEFFRPGRCLPGEERRCGDECPPLRRPVEAVKP